MAIKPIQTIEGGPEYDHWATADQMERLIKSLTTSGISQRDAQQLVDEVYSTVLEYRTPKLVK